MIIRAAATASPSCRSHASFQHWNVLVIELLICGSCNAADGVVAIVGRVCDGLSICEVATGLVLVAIAPSNPCPVLLCTREADVVAANVSHAIVLLHNQAALLAHVLASPRVLVSQRTLSSIETHQTHLPPCRARTWRAFSNLEGGRSTHRIAVQTAAGSQ